MFHSVLFHFHQSVQQLISGGVLRLLFSRVILTVAYTKEHIAHMTCTLPQHKQRLSKVAYTSDLTYSGYLKQ